MVRQEIVSLDGENMISAAALNRQIFRCSDNMSSPKGYDVSYFQKILASA